MQDINTAVSFHCSAYESLAILLAGDVGLEREARSTFRFDQRLSLECGFIVVVNQHHASAFSREENRRCAAVANGVSRRLARSNHDGYFILESHLRIHQSLLPTESR